MARGSSFAAASSWRDDGVEVARPLASAWPTAIVAGTGSGASSAWPNGVTDASRVADIPTVRSLGSTDAGAAATHHG
jgi:hypothetical protein